MPQENHSTDNPSNTFRLTYLPETIKQALIRKTLPFTMLLARPGEAPASGVLVRIDEHYGVLTAEPVIYERVPAFDKSENSS